MAMQIDRYRATQRQEVSQVLADLLERRAQLCRLNAEYALQSLEEAETFVVERGLLTLTPDCSLPSLFGACHEEPYRPGGHGFASWPKTRWRWGSALADRPGICALKIHRGKILFLSQAAIALVDPLCRQELLRASQGAYGPLATELIEYLQVAGPSLIEDVKRELGLDASALRNVRERLQRVGAVVSRGLVVAARDGESERETSELARWDQRFLHPSEQAADWLAELIAAGVRSAVVAPQDEVSSWFSWPMPAGLCAQLVEDGRLWHPQDGWIAETSSRSAY